MEIKDFRETQLAPLGSRALALDAAKAVGFVGLYAGLSALALPAEPLVLAITLSILLSISWVAATSGMLREDPLGAGLAFATVSVVLVGLASFNTPLVMQRLLTFGPLLILVIDGIRFFRLTRDPGSEPGKTQVARAHRGLSALRSALLIVLNEAAIFIGGDAVWMAAMAFNLLVIRRMAALWVRAALLPRWEASAR
ncbi:MAG: hypothetical protein AAGJ91_02365 [Pseudomonadota bacterium]